MNKENLIRICDTAINDSYDMKFYCPESVMSLEGMSSKKVRCLLSSIGNNPGIKYIEVGTWKGSTLFAAANPVMGALACSDDWSQFGGPKKEFMDNLTLYKDRLPQNFSFCEGDFRNMILTDGYHCIFYDGNHDEQSQRDAIVTLSQFTADEFIYIVDDYAWPEVRKGTKRGIEEAGLKILWQRELPTLCLNDAENYWNGLLVSVLSKV